MLRQSRKNVAFLLIFTALFLIIAGCGNNGTSSSTTGQTGTSGTKTESSSTSTSTDQAGSTTESTGTDSSATTGTTEEASATDNSADFKQANDPIVTIEMDNGKKVEIELFPKAAPNTVNNFISLVKSGFYDGLTFHRVIPEFMIQGGDPDGAGTGGPGYSIAGEFKSNNVQNDLKHTRGILSMARAGDPNSGGSQFFIMVADSPQLDGEYAAFGKVISGMDAVDEVVNLPRDGQDKPNTPAVMKKVTVDTKGVTYPEPEKVK